MSIPFGFQSSESWGSYGQRQPFPSGDPKREVTLESRQPSIYATRLTKQPTLIAKRSELEHFKASYRHAPVPACREMRCRTCSDLVSIESLFNAGRPVELQPIYPFDPPEGSQRREAK